MLPSSRRDLLAEHRGFNAIKNLLITPKKQWNCIGVSTEIGIYLFIAHDVIDTSVYI